MAAFHWEARMKQDMIDRRAMQARVQSNPTTNGQGSELSAVNVHHHFIPS